MHCNTRPSWPGVNRRSGEDTLAIALDVNLREVVRVVLCDVRQVQTETRTKEIVD